MRKVFIPRTSSVPENARMFYYATAETISEAENAAPWAADIVEVEGGYLAFESAAEARKWIDQQ